MGPNECSLRQPRESMTFLTRWVDCSTPAIRLSFQYKMYYDWMTVYVDMIPINHDTQHLVDTAFSWYSITKKKVLQHCAFKIAYLVQIQL